MTERKFTSSKMQRVFDVLFRLPALTVDEIGLCANLSGRQVKEALRLLTEKGLVKCIRQQPSYFLRDGAQRPPELRGRRCAPKKK